jgi:hypothetical protein
MKSLDDLIKESVEKVKSMTPAELEAMKKAQCESYVRAETGWPKPKYKIINGAKIYESYKDYCND